MTSQPWIKFYPRDWRGDQALRVVSLAARGLWMEMLCIMHESTPYGHLVIGDQPVKDDALARFVGASVEEVQAQLVELRAAGVTRQTRGGVLYSKRLIDDHKRAQDGRNAKLEALGKLREKPGPSRGATRPPPTQKPEARGRIEGLKPSIPTEAKIQFSGPKEVREAFADHCGENWTHSWIDPCTWQDIPDRALIPANSIAGNKIIREARPILASMSISVLERAA